MVMSISYMKYRERCSWFRLKWVSLREQEHKKCLGFSSAERKKRRIDAAGSEDSLCVAEDNAVITGSQQEDLITRIEMSAVGDSIYM